VARPWAAAGLSHSITGQGACACPEPTAPTTPAVVLDPFSGIGTTVAVAHALGPAWHGIGIGLSFGYSRLGYWRSHDGANAGALVKVRGDAFRKPEPQVDGQDDLFGGVA
jgi:hypothetical protein